MSILVSSAIIGAQEPVSQLEPPAKRKFKYDGKIETTYDKTEDQSLVFFKLIPIKALEDPKGFDEIQFSHERLELTAYFDIQAKPWSDLSG